MIDNTKLSLEAHGAQIFQGAALKDLPLLVAALEHLPIDQAGVRIVGAQKLLPFLGAQGSIGAIASDFLGPDCRAVRAILFDKTEKSNWALGWHQDRTICVKQRIDVAGFGPWTMKSSILHVAPPIEILAQMLTVRVHLDPVSSTNAPLLIALGSHANGVVPVDAVDALVQRCEVATCTADAGDIWVYATPILHASEAAQNPARRRVLQLDFAAFDLPGGLEWGGI